MLNTFLGLLVLFFLAGKADKVMAQTAFEINERLGRGVNMGNMFEAPAEEAWGNPFRDDYFERIATLGFDHVRIPITWDVPDRADQESPYLLNPEFLNRIKYVIDKAYDAELMVIINMHHHEAVFADPAASKSRFLSQWEQISTFFKDYDENLLFEVLNEPHGNLSTALWNMYFKDALHVIRETNPTRTVLIGVAQYGGLSALPQLLIPDDEHLILTIHYYEPFQFTHQGAEWVANADPWLGTKWENTDLEQNAVKSQFQYAINFSRDHQIPIHIGEFGAYSKADLESRVLWTTFLARWFEQQGFSWAYWEFSSGFGFFDPQTNQYLQPLVDALLKNEFPEPVETKTVEIYTSDFQNNNDGWSLSVTSPAQASFDRDANKARISITRTSDQAWHVQFQKGGLSLKNGKRYLVSFDGLADTDMSLTSYVGMSVSPWGSYSGYASASLSTTGTHYEYTFLMNEPDDANARFVFDMGGSTGTASLYNLRIAELSNGNEEVLAIPQSLYFQVYPNPTRDRIYLDSVEKVEMLQVFDMAGRIMPVGPSWESGYIDLNNWQPGVYFLSLKSKGQMVTKRFVVH